MKRFLMAATAAVGLFAASVSSSLADGHGWKPDGPIKMVIAFAAGGGADTQARLIAGDIQAATGYGQRRCERACSPKRHAKRWHSHCLGGHRITWL